MTNLELVFLIHDSLFAFVTVLFLKTKNTLSEKKVWKLSLGLYLFKR